MINVVEWYDAHVHGAVCMTELNSDILLLESRPASTTASCGLISGLLESIVNKNFLTTAEVDLEARSLPSDDYFVVQIEP